jgi:hypothetical protein
MDVKQNVSKLKLGDIAIRTGKSHAMLITGMNKDAILATHYSGAPRTPTEGTEKNQKIGPIIKNFDVVYIHITIPDSDE